MGNCECGGGCSKNKFGFRGTVKDADLLNEVFDLLGVNQKIFFECGGVNLIKERQEKNPVDLTTEDGLRQMLKMIQMDEPNITYVESYDDDDHGWVQCGMYKPEEDTRADQRHYYNEAVASLETAILILEKRRLLKEV